MESQHESPQAQEDGRTQQRAEVDGYSRHREAEKAPEPVTFLPRFIWERWPSEFRSTDPTG